MVESISVRYKCTLCPEPPHHFQTLWIVEVVWVDQTVINCKKHSRMESLLVSAGVNNSPWLNDRSWYSVGSRRVTNRNWTLPKITHGCCWSGGDLGGLVRNICYILLLHISDLNVMASPTSTERYCLGWVCWARMRRVKRKDDTNPIGKDQDI